VKLNKELKQTNYTYNNDDTKWNEWKSEIRGYI